jgi:hypothetical protein
LRLGASVPDTASNLRGFLHSGLGLNVPKGYFHARGMQAGYVFSGYVALAVAGMLVLSSTFARGAPAKPDLRDAFFTNSAVSRIRIELDEAALNSLRQNPRKNVKATVPEGDATYREVAVHLKGETSFEPIDAKPSFTLNFDKFVSGQTFHGLDKIHLNNSTQDPSLKPPARHAPLAL